MNPPPLEGDPMTTVIVNILLRVKFVPQTSPARFSVDSTGTTTILR